MVGELSKAQTFVKALLSIHVHVITVYICLLIDSFFAEQQLICWRQPGHLKYLTTKIIQSPSLDASLP